MRLSAKILKHEVENRNTILIYLLLILLKDFQDLYGSYIFTFLFILSFATEIIRSLNLSATNLEL